MKKISLLILCIAIFIISGCGSREARKFKKDDNVRAKISEIIIEKGKSEYNLDLKPNTDKVKFAFQNGVLLIDSNTLIVPVDVKGTPTFEFDARVSIEDIDGKLRIEEVNIEQVTRLGTELLTNLYKQKHKKIFEEIEDKGAKINNVEVVAETSVFIEDEKERARLFRDLGSDHKAGYFSNSKKYKELMNKYIERDSEDRGKYLPDIDIDVQESYSSKETTEEKFNDFVSYMRKNKNLPKGYYAIRVEDGADTEEEIKAVYIEVVKDY